jgi:phosphoribosylaminoimidazole-succinocarboxamide synthase
MTEAAVLAALGRAYEGLPESAARGLPVYRGKVRDLVRGRDRLLLVASDRLSAFGRAALVRKAEMVPIEVVVLTPSTKE